MPLPIFAAVFRQGGVTRAPADPDKQFDLVGKHIARIRQDQGRKTSRVFVYVERNLGFEAGSIEFYRGLITQTARAACSFRVNVPILLEELIQLLEEAIGGARVVAGTQQLHHPLEFGVQLLARGHAGLGRSHGIAG